MDDCLFWEFSQTNIDRVMIFSKEGGLSYKWKHSKGDSVYELLVIYINTLDRGEFQFNQSGFICKVLEDTDIEHLNGL